MNILVPILKVLCELLEASGHLLHEKQVDCYITLSSINDSFLVRTYLSHT